MVGIPLGSVDVYGPGFSANSQVLVDGQPVPTFSGTGGALEADIDLSLLFTAGVHQISVQNGSIVSNSLPFTVYTPAQGPNVMQALPGFLVAENTNDPLFIVAADVNGDGLSDVVMQGPGNIAVLYGQHDGNLSAAQYISVPMGPYALAVGDIDGNGTADLVSITWDPEDNTITVSVLSGDGRGNFQAPVTAQTFTGLYPASAHLLDLDGDSKPDLVLGFRPPPSVLYNVVWLKNSGGGFAAPTTLAATGMGYPNYGIADFNGDSQPDILYLATDQTFHIARNVGNGTFNDQRASGISATSGLPFALDFNLDGIPDVALETSQSPSGPWEMISYQGNGDGSFTQVASISIDSQIYLVAGDFDHDGFPDLAGPAGLEPSEIEYFFGDGRGNFVAQTVVGPEGSSSAVGDFNGDGIPDVVVPDRFNFVSLALGRKDRKFPSPVALTPANANFLSAGDVNGDGLPEIFSAGFFQNNIPGTVFQNLGNSRFQLAAYTDPLSFGIADMTGKGVVDLLGGNTNLQIWPNNGTPNFSPSPVTVPQPTSDITVADMDGDGRPDFISACQYAECPGQIFYGTGSYQFTPVTVPNLTFPYIIGDFNGDGELDILTGSGVLLNAGNRKFQQTQGNFSLPVGSLTAVGDFNGDGKDDILFNAPGGAPIAVHYSNGDGTFYQATQLNPGQNPGAISTGDFDGDGKTDIAVGLMWSHQACIFFNSGNGQFTRSWLASGAFTVAMVKADLNRRGKADLVIGNFVQTFAPPNIDVIFHQ